MNLSSYILTNHDFILSKLNASASIDAFRSNAPASEGSDTFPWTAEERNALCENILQYLENGSSPHDQPGASRTASVSIAYAGYLSILLREIILSDIKNRNTAVDGIPDILHSSIDSFVAEYAIQKYPPENETKRRARSDRPDVNEDAAKSERLAVIGQLAAGVAHEIGNPLTSISSIVQILKRKINDPFVIDQLNNIKVSIDRIARIVHELVDFSRPAPFNPSPGNINSVIRTAIGMMQYDRRVKNVHIETSLSDSIPEMLLVADQLLQVFINLMINAVDAMTGTGQITIRTWHDNSHVYASITDTGRGIPKILLPKIFDPFFTTKKVGEGTGLGLSVSYGIISKHNGKIEVQSVIGEGSTFTIHLPKHSHQSSFTEKN